MFDTEVRYILASQHWIRDYGLSGQEITGRSHYEMFPDIPERWKEIHRHCLNGAVERCEEEPFPRQDGTTDWCTWEVCPWHQPDGDIGGIIFMYGDTAERHCTKQRTDCHSR